MASTIELIFRGFEVGDGIGGEELSDVANLPFWFVGVDVEGGEGFSPGEAQPGAV